MAEETGHKSWWTTLPGILTQLAAFVTAVSGLVAALYQSGLIGRDAAEPAAAATTAGAVVANPPPVTPEPVAAVPVAALAQPAPPAPQPRDALQIRVGDTLADGVPVPGAGRIETPGTEDRYRFDARPGQRVYFRMLQHDADMSQIKWHLTDANEQTIFDTCLGCGDPGMQTLSRGGPYLLVVGNPKDAATGRYRVRLTDVPPPDRFTIRTDSRIAPGSPGPGAGMIETPGASDEYAFAAAAGQRAYFRMREHGPGMSQIRWRLTDADGQEVFRSCLGCGDPGMQTLSRGGAYTLVVGSSTEPATGPYRVDLSTP